MDTITHGMIGALVGRAYEPRRPGGLTLAQRGVTGALAAAFPDVDYAVFWIDPVEFLATWHRGPTHSVLLVPFWAVLIGFASAWMFRRRDRRGECVRIAALAILSHIASDLITVYGTAVLFPLSDWRPSLGSTLVIDPWLSGVALAGLLISWHRPGPAIARASLVVAGCYVAGEVALQQNARMFAEQRLGDSIPPLGQVHALAQPLSPFHWKVIAPTQHGYMSSTFRLVDSRTFPSFAAEFFGFTTLLNAYGRRDAAVWQYHPRFGDDPGSSGLAREVWNHPQMDGFRRFAAFPVLYRVDRSSANTCVWFTDLRYVYAGMAPSFRYGLCRREDHLPWQPYRLRRFTVDEKVPL